MDNYNDVTAATTGPMTDTQSEVGRNGMNPNPRVT